jgi:energy-coupling factor transport system permease protein
VKTAIAAYYPGDSPIHRLDPRAKLVAVAAVSVALFARTSYWSLAVLGLACLVGLALSNVPPRWLWRGLRPIVWLVAFTFVAQALFGPGEPLIRLGPVDISRAGVGRAAYLSLRLMVLVAAGLLLTLTTAPVGLTDGLAWLGRPLRKLHVPIEELALMVTIALRFIPTLLMELDTITRAQRARGADFSRGGPWRRARALVPLLVPLFVSSFRRADELALAMEARCYLPGVRRTRLHPLAAGWRDVLLLSLVTVVVVLALAV